MHFLGKDGWAQRRTNSVGNKIEASIEKTVVTISNIPVVAYHAAHGNVGHTAGARDLWAMPGDSAGVAGRFGRPPISAAEIDALKSGGAY